MNKDSVLILILILGFSNLLMVETAYAQTIPKPSAPDFTLTFEAQTIAVIIKNQPLSSYSHNGITYYLSYKIEYKDHFEQNWTGFAIIPQQNQTEYTEISQQKTIREGQIDYRVQALMGHDVEVPTGGRTDIPFPGYNIAPYELTFIADTESDYSIQTISITDGEVYSPNSSTHTPTPTKLIDTPLSTDFLLGVISIALIAIVFLLVMIVFLLLYMRKRRTNVI